MANQLKLNSFTANSKSYVVSTNSTVVVKLRRVNNPVVTGTRAILYSETTIVSALACLVGGQLNFKAPYSHDMAAFLNNNVLNHGTDNIFTNASNGDGNNNNIERVDVIFPAGIASAYAADAGFILCERGNNNAHDGFRIVAILGINGSNDPTSFGAVKTCVAGNGTNNGSWGHPSLSNGNKNLAAYVLRKDAAEPNLRVSSNVNQELGGVFFSLADLGVNSGQTIYGYSLIGPDGIANPSSAQLLNTNDATVYPLGTTEAQGGGLDLISINTFYGTNQALGLEGLVSLQGSIQQQGILLEWKLTDVPLNSLITLERSADAIQFSPIYSYTLTADNSQMNFIDKPFSGGYHYRLKISSPTNSISYSRVIFLERKENSWNIYPTILDHGQAFTIENLEDGGYEARFYGSSGSFYKSFFSVVNGRGYLNRPQALSAGIYFVVPERKGQQTGRAVKVILR